MFTGIITAVGRVAAHERTGEDARFLIETGALARDDVEIGESVAVSGVCLTATEWNETGFWADVSAETLRLTTLASLEVGSRVNLERALRLADRLGGHLVSGHVDGVGEVTAIEEEARSLAISIDVPEGLARYVARKGSIALDGVSLTINAVRGASCSVNIVPHTAEQTTIGSWSPGSAINVEVDLVARYLERMNQDDMK